MIVVCVEGGRKSRREFEADVKLFFPEWHARKAKERWQNERLPTCHISCWGFRPELSRGSCKISADQSSSNDGSKALSVSLSSVLLFKTASCHSVSTALLSTRRDLEICACTFEESSAPYGYFRAKFGRGRFCDVLSSLTLFNIDNYPTISMASLLNRREPAEMIACMFEGILILAAPKICTISDHISQKRLPCTIGCEYGTPQS